MVSSGTPYATVRKDEMASIRTPWPVSFPDVIVHTGVRTRNAHHNYLAAKGGDPDAALELAIDLIDHDATAALQMVIREREALLLPVIAEEILGFNAIPDAMAQVVGRDLSLEVVSGKVVQTNKVGHTRARAFQRIVTPPTFAGQVEQGANYVLVDDHVGLGGTLANLRGHIEEGGGTVIAMTALTESRDGRRISLRPETLAMLRERHGHPLDRLWKSYFGYGLDCLTEAEAQNLCRLESIAAIRRLLAQAAIETRSRGLEPAVATDFRK
jgi:hypothetical protein